MIFFLFFLYFFSSFLFLGLFFLNLLFLLIFILRFNFLFFLSFDFKIRTNHFLTKINFTKSFLQMEIL